MFVYPKAGLWPALGIFFSLPQEEKMKQMLNTLNISNFISNVQIIYIYIYLLQNTLHGGFFITEHSTK